MPSLHHESVAEFTFKSVITGVILGVIFGAANAYLGLRVGMTVSASIPAAVISVVVFKFFSKKSTILEVNLSQTISSASTSLATGAIFTIPALFMWGIIPPYHQVVVLCFLGGLLGLSTMIPLRKMLIVGAHKELPYPEGTACAKVLKTTTEATKSGKWIFYGIGVGIVVKLLTDVFFIMPSSASFMLPLLPKAELAVELAPALIAVGYILGYRQSGILVAGSVLSAFVLTPIIAWIGASHTTPLAPELNRLIVDMSPSDIWSSYVRYIGAGAVATAGFLVVLSGLPAMYGAFTAVLAGLMRSKRIFQETQKSTERDAPPWFVVGGIATVLLVAAFVPGVFAGDMPFQVRLVCALGVAVFGMLFVAVAARIVGIVGVTSQPTSGIALVTLLGVATIFAANGWKGLAACAAVLTVGTVVCIAASKAGDISQDLKTGYLVGATPAKQQFGQLIGLAFACWAVALTIFLLGSAYGYGSQELPAPQATLMKTIIEGVLNGNLPWGLVLTGAGITITVVLCGVSGLAFAIGVYLPLSMMMPAFIGGVIKKIAESRAKDKVDQEDDPGVLAASGLVAGEGLAGIIVSGFVACGLLHKSPTTLLAGNLGVSATLLVIGLLCLFLYRASCSPKK